MTRRSARAAPGPSLATAAGRGLPAPILRLRLAAVLAAQLFDYATFTLMVGRHGIPAELNPIVVYAFTVFGLPVLMLAKLALVVEIGSIVVLLGRLGSASPWPARVATFVTIFAVAGGLFGGISNLLAH